MPWRHPPVLATCALAPARQRTLRRAAVVARHAPAQACQQARAAEHASASDSCIAQVRQVKEARRAWRTLLATCSSAKTCWLSAPSASAGARSRFEHQVGVPVAKSNAWRRGPHQPRCAPLAAQTCGRSRRSPSAKTAPCIVPRRCQGSAQHVPLPPPLQKHRRSQTHTTLNH